MKELILEALATAVAAWLETRAEELGLDDYWNQQDERPGIYENCKLADSVLTTLYPGEVAGSLPGEVTTRFAFHEDGDGGHFGVDDNARPGGNKRRGLSTHVIERCDEVGGSVAVATALFVMLARGGDVQLLQNTGQGRDGSYLATGLKAMLTDGTLITLRWKTSSSKSPAIEVRQSKDERVRDHKIHFYSGDSKYRSA